MSLLSSPTDSREEKFYDLPPTPDIAEPGSRDYAILQWCEERLRRGREFVESSIGYNEIESAIAAIFSQERESSGSYVPAARPLSRTRANLVAKTAEDITALMTDTRVFWNYGTHNAKYEAQARLCNKQAEDWYTSRLIGQRIADLIRYYCVAGTSYAHLYYSKRLDDMMVEALDPRTVFPIDPISYHTLQDAKGVIIRQARTPDWVRAEFNKIVLPDVGDTSVFGWLMGVAKNIGRKISGPLSPRGSSKGGVGDSPIPATPTTFVNTCYLDDQRTNDKKEVVYMGDWTDGSDGKPPAPKNSWSYAVKPGEPLYPLKRMIVWTTNCLCYDGPNPYWHAMFPVIKLTLNPWPKAWLGKAPIWDILSLVDSLNGLLKVIDDHAAQLAQPGVVADRNVSKAELNKFNSRVPGYKIRTNLASGKGIQVINPPPLDQSLWEHIRWIQDMIQQLSGTADMSQIAKLNQLPSGDTIDTIMKAMTPGIRLRSMILEGFMVDFSQMYLYDMVQFDSLGKRVAKFGPDAATAEDFDYDPNTFIPDDIPDGTPGDIASTEDAMGLDAPRPLWQRARAMLQSFAYTYKKGSLLNSAALQDRMEDFMLSKMGYLSVFTLWENLGRMNLASPSLQVPSDEVGRLALQQKLGIGMIANAQGRKATDSAPPSLQTNGSGDVTLQTS